METEGNKRKVMGVSRGILLAFMSGTLLSCSTVIVKYLTNIHPTQLVLYRFWASAALNLPPLVWSGENVLGPPGCRTYVAIRAILNAVNFFFQFLLSRYLSVGEAAVLLSTTPVCVSVAAKVFLKEPFGLLQTVSLITTVIGVIFITGLHNTWSDNPRIYTVEDIYGFSSGLVTVSSLTGTYIITRKCKHISPVVLMLTGDLLGIVVSAIAAPVIGTFTLPYRGLQQTLIIVLGLVSYFAVISLILSVKNIQAGTAATMRFSSDVLISFFWQTFFFGHVPDVGIIVGALLVSASVFLIGFSNRIMDFFQYFKTSHSSSQ